MNPETPESRSGLNPAIISIIVVVVIAALAAGIAFSRSGSETDMAQTTEQTAQTEEATTAETRSDRMATTEEANTTPETTSATYANGTYTETGSYQTPGGTESVTVTATLTDGKVTDISAEGSGNDGNSKQYQSQFLGSYKNVVVGKMISDIRLSRLSGSSLTSQGFNAAIEKIKLDAAQ